mmetsp:Transcript_10023/g.14692  ORF Transcript_10023/g.14692 Transcript_10023/m.14692 type:complete len:212 (-) Transcript_10023:622-1257(-)
MLISPSNFPMKEDASMNLEFEVAVTQRLTCESSTDVIFHSISSSAQANVMSLRSLCQRSLGPHLRSMRFLTRLVSLAGETLANWAMIGSSKSQKSLPRTSVIYISACKRWDFLESGAVAARGSETAADPSKIPWKVVERSIKAAAQMSSEHQFPSTRLSSLGTAARVPAGSATELSSPSATSVPVAIETLLSNEASLQSSRSDSSASADLR